MASMGGGHLDPVPVERLLRGAGMLNRVLSAICRVENLPTTGLKADLQARITSKIRTYARNDDAQNFDRLKRMLENPGQLQSPLAFQPKGLQYPSSPAALLRLGVNQYGAGYGMGINNTRPGGVQFKPSPFYEVQQQLGEMKDVDVMAQHRNSVRIPLKAMDYPVLASIPMDPSLRVMVFCSAEAGHSKHDIAFPHQSELKVNSDTAKGSLRGVKNKPGSTKPVDITDMLRLKPPMYSNMVEMTYALTTKAGDSFQKYYFMLCLVRVKSCSALRDQLMKGTKITKESVVAEMINKARDPDIVLGASVLSLLCPLSFTRIQLPCRSISCRHNQCFNAESYLQLQEQAPIWQCPICNNPASFDSLVVDDYVKDILANTSKSVEQVTIEPDGKWHQNVKSSRQSTTTNGNFTSDDDEDLVEIKESRVSTLQNESTPLSASRTPPTTVSREASASVTRQPSGKRPISQVIDLTFSDDDDEPLARLPKRQFTTAAYATPYNPFSSPPGPNIT